MTERYAIYFAPGPGSPLWQFGRAWLGRCADNDEDVPQLALPGVGRDTLHGLTAGPRLYGWHATLKPPFALHRGTSFHELELAVHALAARIPSFDAPAPTLQTLGHFLALMPRTPSRPLDMLAAICVTELDRFRAPPTDIELKRQRGTGLSPRQEALLLRFGHPYVLDEFRFHMTLTDPLPDEAIGELMSKLAPLLAPLSAKPLAINQLAIFHQQAPGQPFRVSRRYALSRSATMGQTKTRLGAA